jgi:hypothetical protein
VQFFFLIAVHEGVGNECAHEQLIADRFHLRYRDTSLPASVATRTLPRIESWVSTWLESFFRPTSELLLDVVDEDGGIACSARNGTDGRDGLVAGWPKTSWRENKSDGDVELGRIRCLVSAVLGKGLPFYGRSGTATVIQTSRGIWCGQNGARQWLACEVLATWVWLRKKMAERRHGVVRSWHWKGWGPTVRIIDRDGEKNEKSSGYQHSKLVIATKWILAKVSIDPGFTSLLDSEDLEGMITDHGRISDG